jgi:hypothetical protein
VTAVEIVTTWHNGDVHGNKRQTLLKTHNDGEYNDSEHNGGEHNSEQRYNLPYEKPTKININSTTIYSNKSQSQLELASTEGQSIDSIKISCSSLLFR